MPPGRLRTILLSGKVWSRHVYQLPARRGVWNRYQLPARGGVRSRHVSSNTWEAFDWKTTDYRIKCEQARRALPQSDTLVSGRLSSTPCTVDRRLPRAAPKKTRAPRARYIAPGRELAKGKLPH